MNQPSSKPRQSIAESAPIEPVTLDCDHVLTHAGGDPELLIQLCTVFLNEIPAHVEALSNAIKDRDHHLTVRALQQLRNSLIVFGSEQVSYTLELLEDAVRSKRAREVQREWSRLGRQLQDLVPQVQRLMLEMSTPRSAVQ